MSISTYLYNVFICCVFNTLMLVSLWCINVLCRCGGAQISSCYSVTGSFFKPSLYLHLLHPVNGGHSNKRIFPAILGFSQLPIVAVCLDTYARVRFHRGCTYVCLCGYREERRANVRRRYKCSVCTITCQASVAYRLCFRIHPGQGVTYALELRRDIAYKEKTVLSAPTQLGFLFALYLTRHGELLRRVKYCFPC